MTDRAAADADRDLAFARLAETHLDAACRLGTRTLSPDHRAVVALRYLGDYSLDEIAARTGQRAGTVKNRLHYALRALRAALDAEAREVPR
ncbi:MAG: sigma factor-like helix-turn-helix DNA-binding protein [Candidatus Limnocylindrales bacterium]